MLPILSPAQMRAADLDAVASGAANSIDELIDRAARAVARSARLMLGGVYGRRVLVVAGRGTNGADGRRAAAYLEQMGIRCEVIGWGEPIDRRTLRRVDLVIDAGLGTGADIDRPPHGASLAAALAEVIVEVGRRLPVLAVDVPSGLDALDGRSSRDAVQATQTITFVALKPGMLLGDGPVLCGDIEIADIGVAAGTVSSHLLELEDLVDAIPPGRVDAHKWQRACWVVAGSPGMTGAGSLCAAAAARTGAGYVRLSSPGLGRNVASSTAGVPIEVVVSDLGPVGWDREVLADVGRFGALVVGPGLGVELGGGAEVRRVLVESPVPIVVDADGLRAVPAISQQLRGRTIPAVLTPHDGEAARLLDRAVRPDRFADARLLAERTGSVVLLKGTTTIVANPIGETVAIDIGDARLASAGTGDVLAGLIGALLSSGLDQFRSATLAAGLHGLAARRGSRLGFVASDLVELIPSTLDGLVSASPRS